MDNIVARISKLDGPYITSLAFRASYTSSSSRPKLDKVEDYFKQLEEMGFGRNCREGKSFVLYRVSPTDIEQGQLDRLGSTREQYTENFAKTPPEITLARFAVLLRKSPFYEDILPMFQARLPKEPQNGKGKKAKVNENEEEDE